MMLLTGGGRPRDAVDARCGGRCPSARPRVVHVQQLPAKRPAGALARDEQHDNRFRYAFYHSFLSAGPEKRATTELTVFHHLVRHTIVLTVMVMATVTVIVLFTYYNLVVIVTEAVVKQKKKKSLPVRQKEKSESLSKPKHERSRGNTETPQYMKCTIYALEERRSD